MAHKTLIIKADGRKVLFNQNKIISTCKRAGASKDATKRIIKKVRNQIHFGIKTKNIYKLVLDALNEEKEGKTIRVKYQLKDAIMRLGPAGFLFEDYAGEILKYYGLKIKNKRTQVRGRCATHEIDLIGRRNDRKILVECKYHSHHGVYTGLKESLYTHARFLDTNQIFDEEIIVCNTKLSFQAKKYAKCIGQQVISWHYPTDSLESIIEKYHLYPITILNPTSNELKLFMDNHIILAKNLLDFSEQELARITKIRHSRIKSFQKLAQQLLL